MLELCVGNLQDAILAEKYGADRLELNSALEVGGLTPSMGLVTKVLAKVKIPVVLMVRPRIAGFCYSASEIETILQDIEYFVKLNIEAIAVGILNKDSSLNIKVMKKVVALCHQHGKKVVFHRAFDVMTQDDIFTTTQKLIDLKVDRILTSGRAPKVVDHLLLLKQLQDQFGSRITFVGGAGVNIFNLGDIVQKTGLKELHGSFNQNAFDMTTSGNQVDFSLSPEFDYKKLEVAQLKKIIKKPYLLNK